MTVLSILFVAACGTNNDNTGDHTGTDQNENAIGDENVVEDSIVDDNANNDQGNVENDRNDANNNEGNSEATTDLITETGIYNGQADPHTIEIETAEGPLAFQLTMEARDDIEALIEGEEVTYKYTEDGDTRTIESIKMSE